MLVLRFCDIFNPARQRHVEPLILSASRRILLGSGVGNNMGIALIIVALPVLVAGGVMFMQVTFKHGFLWTIACIAFAPAQFLFLLLHWDESKKSFFIQLAGTALLALGVLLGPPEIRQTAASIFDIPYTPAATAQQPAEQAAPPSSPPAAPPLPTEPAAPPPPPDTRSSEQRVSEDCRSELGMLCAEAQDADARLGCLRSNKASLTRECRKALIGP